MTREEAIQVLNMVEAHGSLVIQAKEMAIKALEQESVLDKIRAEIIGMDFDFGDFYDHTDEIIEKILQVIDKYRQEG